MSVISNEELQKLKEFIQRSYGGVSMFASQLKAALANENESGEEFLEALRILNHIKQPANMFEINKKEAILILEEALDLINKVDVELLVIDQYTGETLSINAEVPTEFTCTVLPYNASNKNVIWSADNENVTLTVTGINSVSVISSAEEEFTLKCTTVENEEVYSEAIINTIFALSDIVLSSEGETINKGEEFELGLTFVPSNAASKEFTCTTSSSSICSIEEIKENSVVLKGVSSGNAEITITSVENPEISKVFNVEIYVPLVSITPSQTSVGLEIGDSSNITVTFNPSDATNKELEIINNTPSIITVTKTAVNTFNIVAIDTGTGSFRLSTGEAQSPLINVTSIQPVNQVVITQENVDIFIDTPQESIVASILPADASNKLLSWTSSNNSVATVSVTANTLTANVIPVSVGSTIVTATSQQNSSAKDSVNVNIINHEFEGLVFANKTVTYNGSVQSITATGQPSGTTVTYDNNDKTNAGTYTVTANFSKQYYNNKSLTAVLTINKAASVITSNDTQTFTYDGSTKNVVATTNSGATLTFSPSQGQINAGTHSIVITSPATSNYNQATKTVQLVINKAASVISGNATQTFTYDGSTKNVVATTNSGATLTYSPSQGQINAGTYNVVVTSPENANYSEATRTIQLVINKAASVITSEETQTFVEDGNIHNVVATTNSGAELTYSPAQGFSEAGTYEITVTSPATTNYLESTKIIQLIIEPAE